MSNMDFDAIENNKFWKSVVSLIIGGVVGVATLLVVSDVVKTRSMIAAGYEYRRVVSQQSISYSYQWVKVGSSTETTVEINTPEKD